MEQHPGGAGALAWLCGIDGTSAFQSQHGSEQRPASELADLAIGVLADASASSGGMTSTSTDSAAVTNGEGLGQQEGDDY